MNVSKSNWVNPYGTDDAPPMSLRYLNEFVGKLQCASHLLQLQIFPDAKEISESMGLFNAARRFLDLDDADDSVDGIVERVPWDGMQKVVPIRAKIEDIQIHLRRAIVVLVHAHVTLDQALASVHADTIVGVVSVPCVGLNQSTKAMTGCVVKSFLSPQDSIDAKSAALQLLHDDTLVKMVRGSIGTSELWDPLLSILVPLLVLRDNLRIGVLGDASKEFTSRFHQANNGGGGTTLIESFQLKGQYDLVLDLGMLHECMYLIESRVSSALVLKLCQSFQSTLTKPNGVFVCVTPRRKLKGTSYFANPQLKWRLESHSVGTSFVLVCRQQAPKPTAPSRDQVLADLDAVATNFPDQAAPRIVGEITGVRIKSRKLTFLDVSVNGVAMQVVLSRANMTQGHVANPDDVARHLRVGDTVCAQGALESPEKLDAHVISIVASRPVPVKPRYGIQ
ncbi:hypothetical protein DYB31_008372 [Aphanomyces astaci]|uniref:Uncharacterized protein n=1 Tax=Aphanomyces astaci TaxID=112090 RepID=A0A397EK21_APHAT|nr:hypothetical protein DYB31_008372 [Aphanomyces astaci]